MVKLAVLGGWLVFMLMVIAVTWVGGLLRGNVTTFGAQILWNIGWLLWAGGTFVVAWLARRFPFTRENLLPGIATHVGFGIAVGVSILALEFLMTQFLLKSVWPGPVPRYVFLSYIIYKFHVYFLIYWMILGATRAYDFHAKYRASELLAAQLETRLAEAQLLALKTQLQPHFLFNTHHAIISLIVRQDNATAVRMLTQLSDLLRLTLHQPEKQMTTVRAELEALNLYLGIQRERYGDRLQVTLEADPAVLDAEIPWLLLQPLVENALKHGIDTLAERGELHLRLARESDRIVVRVRDNGPGFSAGFDLEKKPAGIGLRNTQARLSRLYGDRFTLAFAGSEVCVAWPFRVSAVA